MAKEIIKKIDTTKKAVKAKVENKKPLVSATPVAKVEVKVKKEEVVKVVPAETKTIVKKFDNNAKRPAKNNNVKKQDFKEGEEKQTPEFEQITVETRRVTKVTKGAKRFRFSALVVVGNKQGRVGVGLGHGKDPKESIDKAARKAKTAFISVTLNGTTIPHPITSDFGAAKILLKPAAKGTGIIAGGSIRPVLELAGIKDIRAKIIGTNNKISNVYCTMKALGLLRNSRL